MVNLLPYKEQIDKVWNDPEYKTGIEYIDPQGAFINELSKGGFYPPNNWEMGKVVRMQAPDDKTGKKSGWFYYIEVPDSKAEGRCIGIGVYGSFKGQPEKVIWSSKSRSVMSHSEYVDYQKQIEAARIKRDAEIKKNQNEAAERAFRIWNCAEQPTGEESYFKSKKIKPHPGIRVRYDKFACGEIVVPITIGNQIVSLQFILNEGEYKIKDLPIGNKKMLFGGRKKGCYYIIDGDKETIRVAEGYATAASIYEATSDTVYICFDSGNLYEVTATAKKENPNSNIIICGDDDQFNEVNAGKTKAMQAAEGVGVDCIFPVFSDLSSKPTDFNDMANIDGLESVKKLLNKELKLYKQREKKEGLNEEHDFIFRPSGILGEIVNYYHATSGNRQEGFAVQTAIAVCSIVCARNFQTNLANRASLFFLNIGKSGTGKEHAKRTLEVILEAANMGQLISGDGYTSGAAVFSALQQKPRHITIIDEFSKYLQAAQNRYSNSHLMEANSQLMQVIGRLDGTLRPKSYATIGITKEKRKELLDLKIVNPAITLLTMATPDDLFDTIDIRSIKDGFLNRFICYISEAEREIRQHKEFIDVPLSITTWIEKIENRRQEQSESAVEKPNIHTLTFSLDAMNEQKDFQLFCIKTADALEEMGLSDITSRANEMALRLSLIVALSRDPEINIISKDDMRWAIGWIKYNLVAMIDKLKMSISSSEHEGYKKEILKALRMQPDGVTWSSMQKRAPFSRHKQKDLKEILQALIDAELVAESVYNDGNKGRPTKLYQALA